MAGCHRPENEALRALLTAADWTYEQLARAVNVLGAENGLALRYDRTSVAHWLAGTLPRRQVRGVVAEVFTRRLRRTVTLTELGMRDERTPSVEPGAGALDGYLRARGAPGDAVGHLTALCAAEADPVGGALLHRTVFRAEALAVPEWACGDAAADGVAAYAGLACGEGAYAAGTCGEGAYARGTFGPQDEGEEALGDMGFAGEFFARAADFGGRHGRGSLIVYLREDVVPRLHTPSPGPADGSARAVLSHAARLVHVLARMYADDVKHGAAQHYYRAALGLSAEAQDAVACAVLLNGISGHAHQLGHHSAALQWVAAAEQTLPEGAAGCLRAGLAAQSALAHAAAGHPRRARAALYTADGLVRGAWPPAHDSGRGSAPDSGLGGGLGSGGSAGGQYGGRQDTRSGARKGTRQDVRQGALHSGRYGSGSGHASRSHCPEHTPSTQLRVGRALAALGEARAALTALRRSVDASPASAHRPRALAHAEIARLLLRAGRVDEGCAAWHRFLDDYLRLRSARADLALAELRRSVRVHGARGGVRTLLCRAEALAERQQKSPSAPPPPSTHACP